MNAVTIQLQTCSPEFPSAERFIELYGCFNWVWDNLLNFFYQVWIVSNNNDNKGLGELGYSSACGLVYSLCEIKEITEIMKHFCLLFIWLRHIAIEISKNKNRNIF